MAVLMMKWPCASVSWCALEFLGTIASVVSGVADAEYDEDGEVLQMKVLSAAEDDDVYAVDDEVTLCMGFTHVHCQNG